MTRRDNDNTKQDPVAAEFPDGTEIDGGADYTFDPFRVYDPDPEMHYFFAANDGNKIRPDGVHRLTAEMGYRRSEKQHGGGADCVLLEVPNRIRDARLAAKRKRDEAMAKAAGAPPDGLRVLPGRKHTTG